MMKDNNMNIQSSKHVLWTGAGFTKNYGAPLASEMWAKIFNHKKIQAQSRIKELMQNCFDYESIYYYIMEDVMKRSCPDDEKYTDGEKDAIDDVVKSAYEYIDTILRGFIKDHQRPTELYNINNLISKFSETGSYCHTDINNVKYYVYPETSVKSFIFTLNQDLFFERLYDNNFDAKLSIPGIENNSEWFKTTFKRPLKLSDNYQLPNEEQLNFIKPDILSDENFFLIKLHGSYNWTSFDGTQKMVIGRGKIDQIQKEPLLRCYFEIFKKVLSQNQTRLLIIGYGFGDDHINRIISESVRDNELKIYIISPESPKEFKKKILEINNFGEDIWKGMSGYFSSSLNEICPQELYKNQAIKQDFCDVFFESF